jgi:hypothetical protein
MSQEYRTDSKYRRLGSPVSSPSIFYVAVGLGFVDTISVMSRSLSRPRLKKPAHIFPIGSDRGEDDYWEQRSKTVKETKGRRPKRFSEKDRG